MLWSVFSQKVKFTKLFLTQKLHFHLFLENLQGTNFRTGGTLKIFLALGSVSVSPFTVGNQSMGDYLNRVIF
jgi:hypothetical protein